MNLQKEQLNVLCEQFFKEIARGLAKRDKEDPSATLKAIGFYTDLISLIMNGHPKDIKEEESMDKKRPLEEKEPSKRKYTKKKKKVTVVDPVVSEQDKEQDPPSIVLA